MSPATIDLASAARPFSGGTRWLVGSLLIGIIGAALLGVGCVIAPHDAALAYLAAWIYAITIALGALTFLMTVNTMNATWPVAIRRVTEAITATFPLLAFGFIPVALAAVQLYPWMHTAQIADPHLRRIAEHQRVYLNLPFFAVRAAFYLLCWAIISSLLRHWSIRQDKTPTIDWQKRSRNLSAITLPLLGLTLTFAAIDWLMSRSPNWVSSIYGFYFFAGGFIAAIALITILAVRTERAGIVPLNDSHYYALGRCLLAFVIFWAYIAFFQFMLMWIGDKPDEVSYYLLRIKGVYRYESGVLVIGHFVLPLLALLVFRWKRRGDFLTAVSAWLLLMHYVDVHWFVMPEGRSAALGFHWLDLAALMTVGGFTVAFALWRARGHAMCAIGDARLPQALRYESR